MKESTPWIVAAVLSFAIGAGGYVWYQWRQPPPAHPIEAPTAAVAPPPAPASVPPAAPPAIQHPIEAASAPRAEPFVLPAPDKADAVIEKALSDLLGRKTVLSMLQVDRFAARVVATVDNLPRKHAASRLWPVQPTPGKILVEQRGDGTYVAPGNAERYAAFVRMVEAVETPQAVALYVRLYPLFQQAYEELGYPGRYFNDRVVEAIDDLLAAPPAPGPLKVRLREISGPIQPARPWVMYEADDPELEARSAGQRIMLRVGEANAARLKAKLTELRRLIAARSPR